MKPLGIHNDPDLNPQRRELGVSARRRGLKVWIPEGHCRLMNLTDADAVIFSVWEREDGVKVLVLEKDLTREKRDA